MPLVGECQRLATTLALFEREILRSVPDSLRESARMKSPIQEDDEDDVLGSKVLDRRMEVKPKI